MSIPSVKVKVGDGRLGILPPGSNLLAIAGVSTQGDVNLPVAYARVQDVAAAFGEGPLVEAAAYAIERYGGPVLLVRTAAGVDGTYGTITKNIVAGGSEPTIDTNIKPTDEFEIYIKFLKGGTVGVDGITYQWSLDGGRTMSRETALGAATSIELADAGGITVDLTTAAIAAGNWFRFRTAAPCWTSQELAAALLALKNTQQPWSFLEIVGDIDSAAVSTIDAKLEEMAAAGRNRRAIGNTRGPNEGETEAAYLTALVTALSASSCRRFMLCAGYAKIDSSISRRRFRRPIALALGPRAAALREDVDLAEINQGPLPGVFIRDANGNPDEHDETVNPGLDDARFAALRTWEGYTGVYVNNPRLFSPIDSDFKYLQFGRVIDVACTIVRRELIPRLSRGIRTMTDGTGRIEEEEALSIEADVNDALNKALIGTNMATSAVFVLSRTDPVLLTGIITYETRVLPKAYPKEFDGEVALVAKESAPVGA